MYLTDEQIMLLEQLTYLTDDVADAAGVLLGPYDSVENLLQQFDDDALQRLEDPGIILQTVFSLTAMYWKRELIHGFQTVT